MVDTVCAPLTNRAQVSCVERLAALRGRIELLLVRLWVGKGPNQATTTGVYDGRMVCPPRAPTTAPASCSIWACRS